jgi:hypothetical protein
MAGVVKSAQTTIEEHWPLHAEHTTKSRTRTPRWSTAEGIVCACGDVLGWPDPDHHETLSQYTKRVAQEQVDGAIAEGKITKGTVKVRGAFGEYPARAGGEPSTQDHPDGDLQPSSVDADRRELDETYGTEPPKHGDDPGPAEPEELDWDEPPDDEPEPERLEIGQGAWNDQAVRDAVRSTGVRSMREVELPTAIEDGDGEDVGTAPIPADAVPDERGNMISGGMSYGQPSGPVDFGKLVDEVTEPVTVFEADADLYPADEAQTGPPYAVGDTVTVAGVEFVKHSESPFPEHNAPTLADAAGQVADDGPPWDAYEDHGGGPKPSNEGIPEEPEVGRDLVPFAGTPLMPSDPDSMDPLNRALPPLDPTLPYTPADVELKILEVLQQGERGERFLREQLARLHQAQHNLDLRYNLAIAKSDARAADQRKAEAWIATERERFEATQAEMLVRALRDNLHNLRAQLSGFQSVARSLGVSLTNALDGRDAPRRVESHREPPPVAPWEYQ